MRGMKLDVIDGEHQTLVFSAWRLILSVTSKRIIFPGQRASQKKRKEGVEWTCVYSWSFSSIFLMLWGKQQPRMVPSVSHKGEEGGGK